MEEPQSTMDNEMDLYDQPYPYDPYYGSASLNSKKYFLLIAIVGFILFY